MYACIVRYYPRDQAFCIISWQPPLPPHREDTAYFHHLGTRWEALLVEHWKPSPISSTHIILSEHATTTIHGPEGVPYYSVTASKREVISYPPAVELRSSSVGEIWEPVSSVFRVDNFILFHIICNNKCHGI